MLGRALLGRGIILLAAPVVVVVTMAFRGRVRAVLGPGVVIVAIAVAVAG